jgi:hypothetical protein
MHLVTRKLAPAVFAIAMLVAIPVSAEAQAYFFADGGVTGFTGDDLDGIKPGFVLEGGIGTRLGESFSISGGFGWSTHSVDSDVIDSCAICGSGDDNVNLVSIVVRPLVHFGSPDSADMFIGAQGGYTSFGADEKATGLIIGPVAGVGFPLGSRGRFGVGGNYSALSLSDDVKGSSWSAVAFVTIGFGSAN